MCDVMTALKVGGMIFQGLQARAQGKYEQGVAEYNARVDENAATQTRNQGIQEENIQRQKTAQLRSRQRAAAAAQGGDVDFGSFADIQDDTGIFGEVDAMRIRENFRNQAEALDQGATLSRAEGRAARARGNNAFTSSLIGAGGTVASKWYTDSSIGASRGVGLSGGSLRRAPNGQLRGFSGGRFGGGV